MDRIAIAWLLLLLLLHAVAQLHAEQPAVLDASISGSRSTERIPSTFASFSFEQGHQAPLLDVAGNPCRPFLRLLAHLTNSSGARLSDPLVIRIGGNSQDSVCYQYPAAGQQGCRGNLTLADLEGYASFAEAAADTFGVNVSFVVGSNLGGVNDATLEAGMVAAIAKLGLFRNGIVSAVEIGNEVDSYLVTHPDAGMDLPAHYADAFSRYLEAYRAAGMPNDAVQGGVFATELRPLWALFIPRLLKRFKSSLRTFSIHNYPTSCCAFWRKNKHKVKTAQLVARAASKGQAELYAPFVEAAARESIPLVLGEANSAACGGQPEVSDAMAAALWSVDYAAEMSKVGVRRINFHGNGSPYAAYSLRSCNTSAGSTDLRVQPLFYGLWFWSEFTASGASWLNTQLNHTTGFELFPNSQVHSVANQAGEVRVAVILKEVSGAAATRSTNVSLSISTNVCKKPGTTATVHRLQPREGGLEAQSGITFDGLGFDNSTDGEPVGRRGPGEQVTLTHRGGSLNLSFLGQPASLNLVVVACGAIGEHVYT